MLSLSSFREDTILLKNYTKKHYYDNNRCVGRIEYSESTGQIGLFHVLYEYSGKTLGSQMMIEACNHIKTDEIWLVSYQEHPFYNKYPNFFKFRDPAHPSVSGHGFVANKKDVHFLNKGIESKFNTIKCENFLKLIRRVF